MEQIVKRILTIEKILQERKKGDRLAAYNTDKVHQKQMEFHKCLRRNRWVFGGNRSGKTECGAVETVWLARGIHPFRSNKDNISAWVVSISTQVQRDVAQSKILSYLNPLWIESVTMIQGSKGSPSGGVIDYILVRNIFGGLSRIGFKSCDQGREKFQGASLDFVWFDEEPPADIYEECRMRILDKAGHIFGTMTPLKGLSWVYDKIYLNTNGDPEVWHISMEWADNPYLPKDEVDALDKSMSADELESRRYGKFRSFGGMVYSDFDPAVHVIEPFDVPKEWYDNISIDPGLNNPLSAHWYAADNDGTVYVIAEHYEAGKDIRYHASQIKKICSRLDWHCGFSGKIEALIDCAANQRTLAGMKTVAELFFEEGIAVNPKVNKELFNGISAVKDYLKVQNGRPRLYIFNTCTEMIWEIKSYWWGKGDVPRKADDHSMDELRYYIMSRVPLKPEKPYRNEIVRHKEKLIKKLARDKKAF